MGFNALHPDLCAVYCVPNSGCEGEIQRGEMKEYNISHRGNCKKKGFTERAELTFIGQNISKSLQRLHGPCKGMTLMKFKRPGKEIKDVSLGNDEKICGPGALPHESFSTRYPDACAVYCVPNSVCERRIQRGFMKQYNITDRGNCRRKGFTQRAELAVPGQNINKLFKYLVGSCKGMTMMKFKKPGKEPKIFASPAWGNNYKNNDKNNEQICGPGKVPYEAFNNLHLDGCSVYC